MDSEPLYIRVLHKLLLSYGGTLTFQECWKMFVGKTSREVEAYLKEQGLTAPDHWNKDSTSSQTHCWRRKSSPSTAFSR
ncbi:hypothetical protein [Pseudovibrio ascidiaceicola]|uniref:hypothetical protein n=1 Tax=Pseudovibrio ascidiaceicola TaxID=285279 RepID=UPI00313BEFDF